MISHLPLRPLPVLNRFTVLAASMLVQLLSPLGNLWSYINRFLGDGVNNAPFDHPHLYGVVHAEARDQGGDDELAGHHEREGDEGRL